MKPAHDWSRETCAEIGKALLRYGGGPLTASQLAQATGRKNAKRTADEMVDAGLLERDAPQPRDRARGRPPTAEYRLVSDAVDALRHELARRNPPGVLSRGQHIVFAEAGASQLAQLFETLASSEAIARASWFALLDGEPQELAVAFAADDSALDGALDLMAELRVASLAARRSVVVGLGSSESLSARSARANRAARRARLSRATREG